MSFELLNPMESFLRGRSQAGQEQTQAMQNATGQVNLLTHLQALKQQQQLQEALASNDPTLLARTPGGLGILKQLQDMDHSRLQGKLYEAQTAKVGREAVVGENQQAATGALVSQLSQPQNWQSRFTQPPQLFQNDQTAEAAAKQANDENLMRQQQGLPPLEFRGQVNNPNITNALYAAAGGKGAIPALIRANSPAPGITPYQAQNLSLRERQIANQENKPVTPQSQYANVQPDASGGFVGLNKLTNHMEKLPAAEGVLSKQPAVRNDPRAEQMYKDYSNQPQVKAANDLEAKMKPVADYMVQFAKTGQSVNANDAALAKLYLSETTPVGSRAYSMDKKELSSLPNLGDRLGNMASSFFAGKDLTDQTRKEMFNYVIQKYKSLDSSRQQIRKMTEQRAKAGKVPVEQIFGAE